MTAGPRAKSALFLAGAFGLSWAVVGGAYLAGHDDGAMRTLALALSMAGPAVAAVACALAFERGARRAALGLSLRPNAWWAIAWAAAALISAGSVAITLLALGLAPADLAQRLRETVAAVAPDAAAHLPTGDAAVWTIALQAVIGSLINAPILLVTEELGWRGYLHHLWRPAGFWRCSLATGVVWGLWHAPAILLLGHNYPDHRIEGVATFVVFCVLLSPLMTLVRDRGRSTAAPAILHGASNAFAGVTLLALPAPAYPWMGIVGFGGLAALAIGLVATALFVTASRPADDPALARGAPNR
ncbi:MAG: CPBP family intramembrane metalloprotease [Alphaproteobacteria bacterium]|nr:CPBP family intramembrane metalloprotease [Alphaproteobacteria bacterium]